MVAVGLTHGPGIPQLPVRRVATIEVSGVATRRNDRVPHEPGLKPTATIMASLRDAVGLDSLAMGVPEAQEARP